MRARRIRVIPETVLISEWASAQAIPAGFNIDFYTPFRSQGPCLCSSTARLHAGQVGAELPELLFLDKQGRGSLREFSENYTKAFNFHQEFGYIAVPSANHDYQRLTSVPAIRQTSLKVAMTFFLTMPGIPFIYYGDEIGMKYQMNLPNKEGSNERSGTRTPMQWTKGRMLASHECT